MFDKCKNIQIEIVDKKSENSDSFKSSGFKKCDSININNEPKSLKKICQTPDVHCYSHTSFNSIVCHWKNEVADMITNMQKRRHNFVQNAKARNMWEY